MSHGNDRKNKTLPGRFGGLEDFQNSFQSLSRQNSPHLYRHQLNLGSNGDSNFNNLNNLNQSHNSSTSNFLNQPLNSSLGSSTNSSLNNLNLNLNTSLVNPNLNVSQNSYYSSQNSQNVSSMHQNLSPILSVNSDHYGNGDLFSGNHSNPDRVSPYHHQQHQQPHQNQNNPPTIFHSHSTQASSKLNHISSEKSSNLSKGLSLNELKSVCNNTNSRTPENNNSRIGSFQNLNEPDSNPEHLSSVAEKINNMLANIPHNKSASKKARPNTLTASKTNGNNTPILPSAKGNRSNLKPINFGDPNQQKNRLARPGVLNTHDNSGSNAFSRGHRRARSEPFNQPNQQIKTKKHTERNEKLKALTGQIYISHLIDQKDQKLNNFSNCNHSYSSTNCNYIQANTSDFENIATIGQGATGTVYKKYFTKIKSKENKKIIVAVKEMIKSYNDQEYKRVLQDMDVYHKAKDCEFIVKWFGVIDTSDSIWVVMQYCHFGDFGVIKDKLQKHRMENFKNIRPEIQTNFLRENFEKKGAKKGQKETKKGKNGSNKEAKKVHKRSEKKEGFLRPTSQNCPL